MDIFINIVNKIPATFWGVVVGSLFTIIGITITNNSNNKRLLTQLKHERDIKKQERELTLKKEIYLAATEAISLGLSLASRLSDLNITYNKVIEPFLDKSSSIAKIYVVAKDDTIKSTTIFMEELSGILLNISRKRIQLNVMSDKMSLIQKQIDQSTIERDYMTSLMKQFNLAGASDSQRLSVFQHNYDVEAGKIKTLSAEKLELELKLFAEQMALAQECQSKTSILNKLIIPIITNIRAELELPFDELSYTKIIEESQKKQSNYLNQFIAGVTKDLEQVITKEIDKEKELINV
ncbi:hypothetical protein [Oryzomonas rubra]|uniref:Uncharacterized protein n=1 Tax=Oryzomonas rubra TaxID=2509454 RepID=A0A5A9X8V4_9BACT|nr:hypothetical protein [Oryzomonas rubra]KAA0888061.1 hypothetical protein ET418_16810 [Oryzomonas rubra]